MTPGYFNYAIEQPENVDLSEMIVLPAAQA